MNKKRVVEELNVYDLSNALEGSLKFLELNYKLLDNLNVFPVPDGDTGVNMLLTMKPPVEKVINSEYGSIAELIEKFNRDITSNSRGNSGFILSRFFNGFSKPLIENEILDSEMLKEAFESGAYEAKTSLMNPVEGTMITIISEMTNIIVGTDDTDITTLLTKAVEKADEILFKTPEMLPTLAKAGVIDSGALGFIYIINGMLKGINNEEIESDNEERYRFVPDSTVVDNSNEIFFQYCTEVIAEEIKNLSIDNFKSFLKEEGNSIAILHEGGLLKIHIHTNNPEKIISEIEKFGTIKKTKIDDMTDQVSRLDEIVSENEEFSILSIIPGDGFRDIFTSLGSKEFIIYDDLPSVKDILDKVNEISCKQIIILPNDKNIIPVATLAQKESHKSITVVLSNSVVQGISAMYGYNEFENFNENIASIKENINLALSLKATVSVRDVQFGNILIKEGDFFITQGDEVLSTGESFTVVLFEALKTVDLSERGNITFYYNDSVSGDMLLGTEKELGQIYPDLVIDTQYGGQRKFAIIIAIE